MGPIVLILNRFELRKIMTQKLFLSWNYLVATFPRLQAAGRGRGVTLLSSCLLIVAGRHSHTDSEKGAAVASLSCPELLNIEETQMCVCTRF